MQTSRWLLAFPAPSSNCCCCPLDFAVIASAATRFAVNTTCLSPPACCSAAQAVLCCPVLPCSLAHESTCAYLWSLHVHFQPWQATTVLFRSSLLKPSHTLMLHLATRHYTSAQPAEARAHEVMKPVCLRSLKLHSVRTFATCNKGRQAVTGAAAGVTHLVHSHPDRFTCVSQPTSLVTQG